MDIINQVSSGTIMSDARFQLSRSPNAPVSSVELLADLQRVAEAAGIKGISARLYRKYGKYSATTFEKRFGSWNNALTKAELEIVNEVNISDERLFENMMVLWEHNGRQPKRRETANPPSTISERPYNRRFGSWTKALEHFVEYANSQDKTPPTPIEVASGHRTSRDPSLRLRFFVLKRDNFRCCTCGRSPASTPGLELHVDHITAWSLGGETVEQNLQTKCDSCNLGKSNVL